MTDSRTDNGMLTDKEIENMLSIITSSGVTDDFDEQHYFPTKYLDSVNVGLKNFCKNLSQFYSFHLQSPCNFSVNTVYETNYESYLRSIPSKTFAFSTTWNNSMLMIETGGEFARMIIHKETYSFLQAQKQNFSDEDCNVINSLIRELVPVSRIVRPERTGGCPLHIEGRLERRQLPARHRAGAGRYSRQRR